MADNTSSVISPAPQEVDDPPKPSKKSLKKAAKQERFAAYRQERRAREKEARKEKNRIKAEKRAAGELEDDDEYERSQRKRIKLEFGGRVVIDLGFEDKMTDKEISSLCSQLAYTYGANRNASYPFSILYVSLNGRTLSRMERVYNTGYKRWGETEWWTEGYEHLWATPELPGQEQPSDSTSTEKPKDNGVLTRAKPDTVVYLTADSEEELLELSPDKTYIIGGICDHNRYKNLCLDKAKESGIRTARLPIGRYLAALPTRKVLTVNQVFEIMVKWVETRNWEEALHSVVPKRKFQAGKKNGNSGDGTANEVIQEVPGGSDTVVM